MVSLFMVVIQEPDIEMSTQVENQEGLEWTDMHLRCACI